MMMTLKLSEMTRTMTSSANGKQEQHSKTSLAPSIYRRFTLTFLSLSPITGMWMLEPMHNLKCSHAYSRDGIMNHIKACRRGKKACACPYPGCNNVVEEKDLEMDVGLERVVKRLKRRMEAEEAQRKQSQAMEMEDDDE